MDKGGKDELIARLNKALYEVCSCETDLVLAFFLDHHDKMHTFFSPSPSPDNMDQERERAAILEMKVDEVNSVMDRIQDYTDERNKINAHLRRMDAQVLRPPRIPSSMHSI